MSAKDLKINLFCKTLNDFLSELSFMYPDDPTLKMCYTMYKGLSSFYKEGIVDQMMFFIKPHSDKILEKDESFFLNNSNELFSGDSWMMEEINRVKSIWVDPSTTTETKECIWKYMITFVKIGKALKKC